MTSIVLHFAREETANFLVAGIPAAARAAHQVALAARHGQAVDQCVIAVPGGWSPSRWCELELARLAPELDVWFADSRAVDAVPRAVRLPGEALLSAACIAGLLASGETRPGAAIFSGCPRSPRDPLRELQRKGEAMIAATGKSGDGIVSRHLNRPVSRAISGALLRVPGITPMHGTIAAAILGLAMALCLFMGGEQGLVIGALLFQFASIVDGVDGEIARATFRSSRTGAMLDSLTDALTNVSFFAGLTFNVWLRGHEGAFAGAIGLVLLAVGLLLIGRHAMISGRPFTFDAVKDHFSARPSRLKQWLTWLTMRDFYAAAAAVCVIVGFASPMLVVFAVVAAAWLCITVVVLARMNGSAAKAGGKSVKRPKPVLADLLPTP